MIISAEDRRARACAELRRGAPIALIVGDSAALVAAAETLSDRILAAIRMAAELPEAAGAPTIAISQRRADALKARAYDGDLARIRLREDCGPAEIAAIVDPARAMEFPLLGPHTSLRDGDARPHRAAIKLCVRAQLLPAALVTPLATVAAAEKLALEEEIALVRLPENANEPEGSWREASHARVPIAAGADAILRVFRRVGWDSEHYALEIGAPSRDKPVLTRLHSACATGDIFGSLKCDCGPQLNRALRQISQEGAGVLLYLQQEGRGIGLANKMRAYALQDQGYDTVEANHRLGFGDDERMLNDGAALLRAMGFRQARLMTNNPAKVAALTAGGVDVVERIPVLTEETAENRSYLRVKAQKSGHIL
ncbi:MAG: GTP cyclohydrolase II [Neomegalonema sp.]|nr:GTP cyclohydrolase II [Neomegalonema sp.]